MIYEMIDYKNKVPVITSKSPVYAETGTTISINDLADIERAVESKIYPGIKWHSYGASDSTNAAVSPDGQSVFAGDQSGEFDVTIFAIGEYGESITETVTVEVCIVD
ncbi:MAG: hypothetical protein ACI4I9_04170 [Porcipelethomonas sp.]